MKPGSDSQQTELRDSGREKQQPKFDKVTTIKSQSGDIFTGQVMDGMPNGLGKVLYVDGDVYEGQFLSGVPNGMGTMKYLDDDFYQGMFEDGQPNGQGIIKYADGKIYKGLFKDGMPIEQVHYNR